MALGNIKQRWEVVGSVVGFRAPLGALSRLDDDMGMGSTTWGCINMRRGGHGLYQRGVDDVGLSMWSRQCGVVKVELWDSVNEGLCRQRGGSLTWGALMWLSLTTWGLCRRCAAASAGLLLFWGVLPNFNPSHLINDVAGEGCWGRCSDEWAVLESGAHLGARSLAFGW